MFGSNSASSYSLEKEERYSVKQDLFVVNHPLGPVCKERELLGWCKPRQCLDNLSKGCTEAGRAVTHRAGIACQRLWEALPWTVIDVSERQITVLRQEFQ